MDIVEKRCDFKMRTGRMERTCGQAVPDNEPTEFALAPDSYSADLCSEHRQTLSDVLSPFIEVGRRSRAIASVNSRGRKVLRGKGGKTFTTRDVREWLQEQGRDVPPTGRVPNVDIEEFMNLRGGR